MTPKGKKSEVYLTIISIHQFIDGHKVTEVSGELARPLLTEFISTSSFYLPWYTCQFAKYSPDKYNLQNKYGISHRFISTKIGEMQ